jgi:HAD superfamily hydrolase (TIGR01549 family)
MASERRAVIFDMDGTLTQPVLDFDRIREEIGGLVREPILEAMQEMSAADRARAEAILERHEADAAANGALQPGAAEVVAAVRANGMHAVLMTRNSRRSVEVFQARHGISFDKIWTREDGAMKPSPEPVLAICRALGTQPDQAWMAGDYHYDIICGRAAGTTTVLLLAAGTRRPAWADEADHVIYSLGELLALLDIGVAAPGERTER